MPSEKRSERGQLRPQAEQRLPRGHFDSDGLSKGEQTGCVRKTPDAYQGPREDHSERGERE